MYIPVFLRQVNLRTYNRQASQVKILLFLLEIAEKATWLGWAGLTIRTSSDLFN